MQRAKLKYDEQRNNKVNSNILYGQNARAQSMDIVCKHQWREMDIYALMRPKRSRSTKAKLHHAFLLGSIASSTT
jgi:hypothetical protein